MSETGPTRPVNALRALSLILALLALSGSGSFVYAAESSRAVQKQLQAKVGELKIQQSQLVTERDEAQSQLATAQDEIADLRVQLATAQRRLDELEAAVSRTGSVQAPKSPAKTRNKVR
jgi:septal ring factor EnvC (AmiA/AmiB activator)